MPQDEIAQGEIAALTRRYENNLQILRGDIAGIDNRMMSLETAVTGVRDDLRAEVSALSDKIDRNQAQIIELLTRLVGRHPDAP
ncbi:hypothetical protein OG730_43945 (plasmid) [Streptomyces sp. NBC_01298]|uniref:hypothetical protein n=1 Tax=Streptomyces sp. NBC_01298 TaxID=2903817 RepID=UPI002E0F8524|nr:hypothetical protein OG730_44050 [Streptomyces sp. NBC_01298]WSK26323.1 hypothetical protein OG730_43945 [Streptomyces sp. NBC_01298]